MKKVLFTGLSPYGNFTYNERQYANGAILECDDSTASALIESNLAVDVNEDGLNVQKLKEQVDKDNKTRQAILKRGGKK